jgi:acetoin utilization deacetylase AcuC-like enzyme
VLREARALRQRAITQRAKPATKREMTQFHSDEYIDFLSRINPGNMHSFVKEQGKCAQGGSRTRRTRGLTRCRQRRRRLPDL